MNKSFLSIILISILSLFFLTGCDDSNGGEDTQYKPSEYKHNVAINNASVAIDDINKEIISMGAETSADIVLDTYNESLTKLNTHLTTLKNTQEQLSEDKDLSNSELKDWTARYKDMITAVIINIEKVQKQKTNFLK